MDLYFASAFLPDAPDRTTVVTLHNTIELPGDPAIPTAKRFRSTCLAWPSATPAATRACASLPDPRQPTCSSPSTPPAPTAKPDGPTRIAHPVRLDDRHRQAALLALRFLVADWRRKLGLGHHHLHRRSSTWRMLPTRFMMMKSSLKMMRIQPKVDAIKKRYANLKMNDPKRAEMNTEMMALYKTEGVNMYGSCLPMLLQMPLFFAYFRVLQNAVELRQAHWFWLPISRSPIQRTFCPSSSSSPCSSRSTSRPRRAWIPPAPHDGLHDARHLRLHALALRLGTGALLGHGQHHESGHADRHQPLPLGKEMHAIAAKPRRQKARRPKTVQGKR
jgi:YidC/Oxa1 family membrane protein insertase